MADGLENKHKPANQQNKTKKALEKFKSFMAVVHFQHPSRTLSLPQFTAQENHHRVCLVETGLYRESQAQVSGCTGTAHLTASGSHHQAEQTGSIPVYMSANTRSLSLAALPAV